MKHLWIAVLLVGLAGLQFAYEYKSHSAVSAADCLGPESSRQALREGLLQHMHEHR